MTKSEQLTIDEFLNERDDERSPYITAAEEIAKMSAEGLRIGLERSEPKIQFKRLHDSATLPTKAHPDDSGFDLYASEDVIIEPGETKVVPTGVAVGLPQGTEAQVRPRSGITSKTKLRVQLGTIDNGYTGEIGVIVDNTSTEAWSIAHIDRGTKIAQLVVQYLPQFEAVEVDELTESARGRNGFGSTDEKEAE